MNKSIFRTISILSAFVVVFIAAGRIIKVSDQQHPQLPQVLYSVSTLRYQAYTSAFEGQHCIVRGICIKKEEERGKYYLYIRDTSNSETIPLKCQLINLPGNKFLSLQILSEIVLSGKLAFWDGLAEITDGKIISINQVKL